MNQCSLDPARRLLRGTAWLWLAVVGGSALADVRLPALFGDQMVLQRGEKVPVWGWADDGEKVTVSFRGRSVSAVARGGKWLVYLPSQKAGGPDTLVVSGRNRIELHDVLVGEVWVCSGQSNMEWPLRITEGAGPAIASSANPKLRLFTVPKLKADEPVQDVKSSWRDCGPTTVSNFSAVAYYFGRDLQQALGIPVGLIHTSWGGSPAEVWLSRAALEGNPRYRREILEPYAKRLAALPDEVARWEKEAEQAKQEGREPARGRPNAGWKPTELYNGMIAPLLPYGIRGAIWYQGESNAGRAEQYRQLFPDMIRNWREDFRQEDLTFLCVQLAPWDFNRKRSIEEITAAPGESAWAELREAQGLTTLALPKVGMAVITDVGDKDDIHPQKKAQVGARLALSARRIAYGEKILDRGPVYRSLKVRGSEAVLTFDSVDEGLEARGPSLTGFAVCGEDRKWVWADARIQGRNRVIVSSPAVARPVAVRFGWADFPVVNLFNRAGLPASPFRTDDFPLTTQGKF